MNLIGRMLANRYEILEKIGNGGMATVYKAKCHVLNRFVAVKVLKEEFITDIDFIKSFFILHINSFTGINISNVSSRSGTINFINTLLFISIILI